jgi:hypothetical protein
MKKVIISEKELISLIENVIVENQNEELKSGLLKMANSLIDTFPNEMQDTIRSAFDQAIKSGNPNDLIKSFPSNVLPKFMKLKSVLERRLSKLTPDLITPETLNNIGVESANSIGEKCEKGEMLEQVGLIWGVPIPLWNRCLNIVIKLAILFCIYYTFWYLLTGRMRQH